METRWEISVPRLKQNLANVPDSQKKQFLKECPLTSTYEIEYGTIGNYCARGTVFNISKYHHASVTPIGRHLELQGLTER